MWFSGQGSFLICRCVGRPWLACFAGGMLAAALWLSLADTPFLQDDYGFLYEARMARASGEPYAILALASGDKSFWRPLSVGLHWRVVADIFAGSPVAAHLLGIGLIGLAAACVARFSVLYIESWLKESINSRAGFWAGLAYGFHGAQLFPAAWACAVQETYAVLWSALALLLLLEYCRGYGRAAAIAGAASAGAVAMALLSKEGPVMLPLLGGIIWLVAAPTHKRGFGVLTVWVLITVVWLWIRSLIVTMPAAGTPYAPTLGINVIQNLLLALLYMVNLPREALLLWLKEHSTAALAWGGVCFLLQAAGWVILLWACRGRIRDRQFLALPAFAIMALVPYLPLFSQSYSYYTLLALLPYAVLVTLATTVSPAMARAAVVCAVASTTVLIAGERLLPYPAPIARARWADETLKILAREQYLQQSVRERENVHVHVSDDNRLAAIGYASGIAMVFGLEKKDIALEDAISSQTQLSITREGLKIIR